MYVIRNRTEVKNKKFYLKNAGIKTEPILKLNQGRKNAWTGFKIVSCHVLLIETVCYKSLAYFC